MAFTGVYKVEQGADGQYHLGNSVATFWGGRPEIAAIMNDQLKYATRPGGAAPPSDRLPPTPGADSNKPGADVVPPKPEGASGADSAQADAKAKAEAEARAAEARAAEAKTKAERDAAEAARVPRDFRTAIQHAGVERRLEQILRSRRHGSRSDEGSR